MLAFHALGNVLVEHQFASQGYTYSRGKMSPCINWVYQGKLVEVIFKPFIEISTIKLTILCVDLILLSGWLPSISQVVPDEVVSNPVAELQQDQGL